MIYSVSIKRNLRGLLLTGFILTLFSTAAWSSQVLIPQQIPVPKEYFGLHIHHASPTQWPETQFGSWRLIDAYVNWFNLQEKRGNWDFTKLDDHAFLAHKKGIDLLMPLAFSPKWASAKPDEKGPYGSGSAAPPKDINDWRNYITKIAKRYNDTIRGKIRNFELWNEVNEPGFFSGGQDDLLILAKEAYTLIKEVNPANRLVSPSGVGGGAFRWLESYFEKGGGNYADIIGFHFYIPSEAPEAMVPNINKLKEILKRYGLEKKPLWNTEMGWWIDYEDGTPPNESSVGKDWTKLNPNQGAAFVSRALILGWAAGLDRFYWYAWDNQNMGLIEPTTHKLKSSGEAYNSMARWMTRATVSQCKEDNDGLWECILIRDNGEQARIVWATGNEQTYELPAEWKTSLVKLNHLNGKSEYLTENKFIVRDIPVLISLSK